MKTLLQLFPTATQTLPFNCSVTYGLMGIVDGSETSPPKFTSTEHKNQGIVNPGYMVWQYLLGWIISSLSPAVVSTIYGLETSRLAWQALGARFATPSTSRISLIKRKLQSLQQGSMQCQEFLDAVKALADELSAVGKPIEDSDLILSVLNGLNSSFHSFVTTYMLMAKEKSMSFSDFHAELLNFDLMQKFHSHNIQQETSSYAFYGHKSVPKQGFRQNKPRFSAATKSSNVVCCPQASAKLLSINKFCKDNNVLFELTGTHFSVKDMLTGDTLLTGPSENGLYPINLRQLSSSRFQALTMTVGVKASTSIWHCRLGHPSAKTLSISNSLSPHLSSPSFNCSFVPPYDNPNPIQNVEQNSTQTQTLEENPTAPGTDLPSSASLPQPIERIDNHITLSLSNSSLGINSNSSIEPASSLPSDDTIPLHQPSSRMITRSQTGHSAPRMFPEYHLHYTTRHPLKAFHTALKPCIPWQGGSEGGSSKREIHWPSTVWKPGIIPEARTSPIANMDEQEFFCQNGELIDRVPYDSRQPDLPSPNPESGLGSSANQEFK
ncbi:hypothetical protein DKX38_008007 [Salix brachista]|uniref:GAG-pre-integrase domain-containing protein n=1 Tax=Salix brachista TaxID=2182728 RepID=A0A5N5MQ89_9ROSI|nr:hypothetical protein DKX38_008007 [Salix brachista]